MKLVIILFAFVVTFTDPTFAQVAGQSGADPTATRTLTIGAFAGASYLKPDEGNYYDIFHTGYVAGLDATRTFGRTSISIDPTFGRNVGKDTSFTYYMGDILIARAVGPGARIHPTAVLGIGYGVIDYPGHSDDNSILRDIGLGISYDVSQQVAVRAAYVYQFWNVGHLTPGFNPNGIQGTLLYRFGFGLRRLH